MPSNDFHHVIQQALTAYDLPQATVIEQPSRHNHVSVLFHTATETLRCKIYSAIHTEQALLYEHDLLQQLADHHPSFALPLPLRSRHGTTLQYSHYGWLAILPYLPGTLLDPEDLMQCAALGSAIGELHQRLSLLRPVARPGHALFSSFFAFPPAERDPFTLTPTMIGAAETAEADAICAWWRSNALTLDSFLKERYQQLPMQLVHNDLAPYNVLVENRQLCAILDFEFAGLAARAFDLAMALRMTMRVWENPDPWTAAMQLCKGYRHWASLTEQECACMPQLILLRSCMGTLWSLGRGAPIDATRFLQHLEFLRNAAIWLDQHGEQLVALLMRELSGPA